MKRDDRVREKKKERRPRRQERRGEKENIMIVNGSSGS